MFDCCFVCCLLFVVLFDCFVHLLCSVESPIRAMNTTVKTIIAREGLRGLYRGLLPQLIGIVPEKVFCFLLLFVCLFVCLF
jgi:hypothetical protein